MSVPQHTCMHLLKGTSHAIPPHGVEYHQPTRRPGQWLLTAPVTSATRAADPSDCRRFELNSETAERFMYVAARELIFNGRS